MAIILSQTRHQAKTRDIQDIWPILLAHLSQSTHGPSSSSFVLNFTRLPLRSRLSNQSQILYGASLGKGDESLCKWSWSHDQDGRHTLFGKTFENLILQNRKSYDPEDWHVASKTQALQVYINDDIGLTMLRQGQFGSSIRLNGKKLLQSYNGGTCSKGLILTE